MLDRLVHLQETDEKIVAFQREEGEIPVKLKEKEVTLEELLKEREQVSASLSALDERLSLISKELGEVKEHQRRCQARTLAVKTQREYQAVQRETEIARKKRGDLDGQLKEFSEEQATIVESLAELDSKIEEINELLGQVRTAADGRLKEIQGEREDLEKNREVEASLIEPDLLAKYQKVFETYKGKGVVRVSGGVCNGCFMTIPPQLYNQVLAKGGIHQCPNCGRIIYEDQH
ncbi:MAG: C4-type zinc ribbon domain-containing protein [bacterium]|nr:C4-type zinc ribbon domain-containing protein [bacterium]MDT8395116.1 C4-type zinc ribbon domain-containing protein [bacterium]